MTDRSLIKSLALAVFAMALSPALGCTTTSMNTMAESFGSALIVATEATAENWGKDDDEAEGVEEETTETETTSCEGPRPKVGGHVRPPAREGYRWVSPRYRCVDGEWEKKAGYWRRRSASSTYTPSPTPAPRPKAQCRTVRDHRGGEVKTTKVCDHRADATPAPRPKPQCREVRDHRGGEVVTRRVCDHRTASKR